MGARKFVAVRSDGVFTVHAASSLGNYATLCTLSTDDDEEVGREVPLPRGAKINCRDCVALIVEAKKYRAADIAKEVQSP